jgi:hypothetical protein
MDVAIINILTIEKENNLPYLHRNLVLAQRYVKNFGRHVAVSIYFEIKNNKKNGYRSNVGFLWYFKK